MMKILGKSERKTRQHIFGVYHSCAKTQIRNISHNIQFHVGFSFLFTTFTVQWSCTQRKYALGGFKLSIDGVENELCVITDYIASYFNVEVFIKLLFNTCNCPLSSLTLVIFCFQCILVKLRKKVIVSIALKFSWLFMTLSYYSIYENFDYVHTSCITTYTAKYTTI